MRLRFCLQLLVAIPEVFVVGAETVVSLLEGERLLFECGVDIHELPDLFDGLLILEIGDRAAPHFARRRLIHSI